MFAKLPATSRAVLIVEDETIFARNIQTYLRRRGYEVKTAGSAEDALVLLDSFKPDAVLLDLRLPGMDGIEALARFRAGNSALPIIIMTAHGSVETAVDAMTSGAYDFLTKPVALSELGLLLEEAIGDKGRERAQAQADAGHRIRRAMRRPALAPGVLPRSFFRACDGSARARRRRRCRSS